MYILITKVREILDIISPLFVYASANDLLKKLALEYSPSPLLSAFLFYYVMNNKTRKVKDSFTGLAGKLGGNAETHFFGGEMSHLLFLLDLLSNL